MYENHLYKELTYKIIGAAISIHKELGPVHKEIVYHNALKQEFRLKQIPFSSEKILSVHYKGKLVGTYKPDFIIDDKVVLEIKGIPVIPKSIESLLTYYLKATGYKIGLLLNFGARSLELKRRIYEREFKSKI